ncbi:MAG: hypothetical protein ACXVPR_06745, partial [Actinomycetota bacterium]
MRVRSSPITSAVGAIVLALAVFALRAQWRVYGAVGAVIFFVLFLVLLSLDNRHRPEFERVERTVKRHGRTEVHWEEHSYGTTILVEGAARISATGRLEATGEVQRRFPVACTYNENVWWLILDMPDSEVAVFRVKVTDPLGAEAR